MSFEVLKSTAAARMILLLLAALGTKTWSNAQQQTSVCEFSKSVWHFNSLWHSRGGSPTPTRKAFILDSINASHFTIHSLNGSFADTTATVIKPRNTYLHNVTAQFSNRPNVSQGILGDFCNSIVWTATPGGVPENRFNGWRGNEWRSGPLPPPPLPPPVKCETSFNKAACDAVKPTKTDSCVWCTSDDGAHALCFHKGNEPDSGSWKCDGAATSSY